MFPVLQNPLAFLARALIALLFIPAGIAKIIGFMGTMGYIAAMGVPFPSVAAVIAIVVELGLGLLLLAGFQTRWSALVLAVFTLVITLIFHPNRFLQPSIFYKPEAQAKVAFRGGC